MPYNVEHKLDAVLAVFLTRGAAEGVIIHRRMQTLVEVVHGEVMKEDVAVGAVVDSRVACGSDGGGGHISLFLALGFRNWGALGGIVGCFFSLQMLGNDSGLPVPIL